MQNALKPFLIGLITTLTLAAIPLYFNYQDLAPFRENKIAAMMIYGQYRESSYQCDVDQGLHRFEGCVFTARYILAGSPGSPEASR